MDAELREELRRIYSRLDDVHRSMAVGQTELTGEMKRMEQKVDDHAKAQADWNVACDAKLTDVASDAKDANTRSQVNSAKVSMIGAVSGAAMAFLKDALGLGPG